MVKILIADGFLLESAAQLKEDGNAVEYNLSLTSNTLTFTVVGHQILGVR
jgi:hypothetical protein